MNIQDLLQNNASFCFLTEEDFLKEDYFELPNVTVIIPKSDEKVLNKVKLLVGNNYVFDGEKIIIEPVKLEQKERFGFSDLVNIVKILRSENGCPWDKAQTYQSLKGNILEEAYEVLEAIEKSDFKMLKEELGDLILQPVFLANIAETQGSFSFLDIFSEHCKKLIFRHSHIFGGDTAASSMDALATWDKNKNIEKNLGTLSQELDAIPKTLPALMYAAKVLKKIKKYERNLDFIKDKNDIFYKLLLLCKQAKDNDIELEIEFSKWLKCLNFAD